MKKNESVEDTVLKCLNIARYYLDIGKEYEDDFLIEEAEKWVERAENLLELSERWMRYYQ